jgi:hypothetical protein
MGSHRSVNEWYVAKNGSNTAAGGPVSPFLTVQHALNQAAAATAGSKVIQTIFIAPGTYVENLTISTGYVRLCGTPPGSSRVLPQLNPFSPTFGCDVILLALDQNLPVINLNVTANVVDSTVEARKVILEGLSIQNSSLSSNVAVIQTPSTVVRPFTLIVQNCTLMNTGRVVYFAPNVATSDVCPATFLNCAVLQPATSSVFSSPVVECATGTIAFRQCSISAVQNATLLLIGGTAVLNTFQLNDFFSGTAVAAAAPIVRIASLTSYVTPMSNNVLAYTTTPSTARPSTSCAIEFGGATIQSGVFLNNLFLLTGTTVAGLAIRADTPSAAHFVYAANNFTVAGQARSSNVSLQALTPILNT